MNKGGCSGRFSITFTPILKDGSDQVLLVGIGVAGLQAVFFLCFGPLAMLGDQTPHCNFFWRQVWRKPSHPQYFWR
jgi:hypothetical protein